MWHNKAGDLPNAFITGIDQVCVVTKDFDATVKCMNDVFGIGPFKCWNVQPPALFNQTFRGKKADWTMKLGVAVVGRTQWEIIQPVNHPSLFSEFLSAHGSGPHHILLETKGISHGESVQRLEAQGFSHAQTAMLNVPLKVGPITIPAAPQMLAEPLSTHFGYMDSDKELGVTLELAQFPPGISRPVGVRLGKADFFVPDGANDVLHRLPNSFVDEVTKLSFVTRDVMASAKAWADKCGVGPWHIIDLGPPSLAAAKIDGLTEPFHARVAWALVGDILFELIEPVSKGTPHERYLAEHGPGLSTIGVRSETITVSAFADHMRVLGYPVLVQGVAHGGYEFALVDASKGANTWIEMMQLPARPLFEQLKKLSPSKRYPG